MPLGSLSSGVRKPSIAWNLNSTQAYRSDFDYIGGEGIAGREESLGQVGISDNGNLEKFCTKWLEFQGSVINGDMEELVFIFIMF